jgi:hypothetical protein
MAIKLKFENRTRWDGRVIRSLVLLGLREHGIRDRCEVVVRYQRKGSTICGLAAVGGRWMELIMPRETDPGLDLGVVVRKLSSTIDHEILHLRGLMHRQFPAHARYCTPKGAPWHPPGCLELPVLGVLGADTAAKDPFLVKLAHARKMHGKALTRLKRAATIEAKWKRRVKAMEKRVLPQPTEAIEEALKLVAGSPRK